MAMLQKCVFLLHDDCRGVYWCSQPGKCVSVQWVYARGQLLLRAQDGTKPVSASTDIVSTLGGKQNEDGFQGVGVATLSPI